MESLSSTPKIATTSADISKTAAIDMSTEHTALNVDTSNQSTVHHTKNLYPVVRHTLLIICVLFSIALIILLMHQNGKSIYDNGI